MDRPSADAQAEGTRSLTTGETFDWKWRYLVPRTTHAFKEPGHSEVRP